MFVHVCTYSQQPIPERLQIRVNRISMAAYEALHYDKDQLKEACESHLSTDTTDPPSLDSLFRKLFFWPPKIDIY